MDTKEKIKWTTRENRSEIIDFYLDGEFDKLPVYSVSELSREQRILGDLKGWVIPQSCYGQKQTASALQRETIRQFIYRHFPEQAKETMVAYENWREAIVIYRRSF